MPLYSFTIYIRRWRTALLNFFFSPLAVAMCMLFAFNFASAQRYNFKTYSLEDGLVQSQVMSLAQDHDGNLWIGTFGGGVNRFDGNYFETYTTHDGLVNNDVRTIITDSRGNLWFGSTDGISVLQRNSMFCKNDSGSNGTINGLCFKNYNSKNGLPGNEIRTIFEDSRGDLWFSARDSGVAVLANPFKDKNGLLSDEIKFIPLNKKNGLADSIVYEIAEDAHGNMWFGTAKGLSKLPSTYKDKIDGGDSIFKTISSKDGLISNMVYNLAIDQQGRLWCASVRSGISLIIPEKEGMEIIPGDTATYDIVTFSKKEELEDAAIYDIIVKRNGKVLITSISKGIAEVYFDEKERKIKIREIISIHNGLPTDDIWALFEDREENIWLGTNGFGISKFTNKMFGSLTIKDGLSNEIFFNIVEDKEGLIWMGTIAKGISVFDPDGSPDKQFINYSTADGLKDNYMYSLFVDSKGQMWGSMFRKGGVYKFNIDRKKRKITSREVFSKNDSISYNYVSQIFEDSKGSFWFGTAFSGLFHYYDNKFAVINKDSGLISNSIASIIEDRKGQLWLVTRDGLSRLRMETDAKTGKTSYNIRNFSTTDGMISNYVISILEDSNGNIWLGCQGGLSLYNPATDKFTNFTSQDGLSADMIYLVNEDKDGNIWIGTNKGVDKIRYGEGKINVKSYGKLDGFIGIETNSESTIIDKHGRIWFGTIIGAMIYDPKEEKINNKEPLTSISNVRLFFENVDWTELADTVNQTNGMPVNVILPYDRNHLTFEFVGVSLTVPEKVRYRWKLEGFDKEWSPVTAKTEATYSNISPGEYTFMVQAANNDGIWNTVPAKLSFVITPPFWQTWWFYLLVTFSVVGGVFLFIKIREKALQKEKRVLEEKVHARTKDLQGANEEILNQKALVDQKNRDITASINYAQRIQGAILPGTRHIKELFGDSFMFYKVKDVVSGDFPWLLKNGDDIYITVVDCTGHGIPGAMLSMIAHFLLNEIVIGKKINDPSEILNLLHLGINETLRQEEDSQSRDGLDIAFCKVNLSNDKKTNGFIGEVSYAGAHRPLYYNNNGELNEISGDKFPIGGVQYARQGKDIKFKNHIMKIKKGDSIYCFSDGLSDQIGGPENKKFLSSRVRDLITQNKNLPMDDVHHVIEKTFNEWMGNNKQIDDVLMIGIRF